MHYKELLTKKEIIRSVRLWFDTFLSTLKNTHHERSVSRDIHNNFILKTPRYIFHVVKNTRGERIIKCFSSQLGKLIINFLTFIIGGLRPILGPAACKYPIGCTQYAIQELETQSFFIAWWHIIKRVTSCNPFTRNIS